MRLLVHMPTRARPQRCLVAAEAYRRLASKKHDIVYSFSIDEDDKVMASPPFLDKLRSIGRVHIGKNKSKVEACNAGIERDFDIILLASDDMLPISREWDNFVAEAMNHHFPNLDGALHFPDGRTGDKLNTYPIFGINLFKKFGYVYHPDYFSLCCDTEWTELLRQIKRLPFIDRVLFRHDHHSMPGLQRHKDPLYARNDALMDTDKKTYDRRAATILPGSRFNFGHPPIRLSILIATMFSREAFLRRLLTQLNDEINGHDIIQEVEIVIDRDNGEASIGVKRQRLLERAVGDYVAFIDDDDLVCPDYCRQIVGILRKSSPDCLGLVGEITEDGNNPRKFIHSINNPKPGWYEEGSVYYRGPNHLNPVKRELALAAGFADMTGGEDHDFSMRLERNGLIKGREEVMLPGTTYLYLCRSNKGENRMTTPVRGFARQPVRGGRR